MKKIDIIKKSFDYTKIINKKNNFSNKYYSFYIEKSDINHYGISVPTKTGHAVIRNKLKRQIKNIIDNNKINIPNGFNYVIILKRNILNLSFNEKEKYLLEIFQKIGESNEKKEK